MTDVCALWSVVPKLGWGIIYFHLYMLYYDIVVVCMTSTYSMCHYVIVQYVVRSNTGM